jgi:hypothetical protein
MYTRFTSGLGRNKNQLQSDRPLTDDQIRSVAPSVFAEKPHSECSDTYTFIPTSVTLAAMRSEGFEPFFVSETKARKDGKQGFTKHMIRYRQAMDIASQDEVREIIQVNAHDKTSSDKLMAGFFRAACANGCFAGTLLQDVTIPHRGDVSGRVIEGAYRIINEFDQVEEALDLMKSTTLQYGTQFALAKAAAALRFPDKEELPIDPARLLWSRREEDQGNTAYLVYQRIQEAVVRGGVQGTSGRLTRGVSGISEVSKLNRALFDLALAVAKERGM